MFCPQCGKPFSGDQKFCAHCGAALDSSPPRPQATSAAASQVRYVQVGGDSVYGSFGRRALAYFIDHFIGIAALLLFIAFATLSKVPWLLLLWAIFVWLYKAGLESSKYQATLGKMALGLQVTDRSGERISFLHSTGRFFAFLVSCCTMNIAFLIAAFTDRRQALHDLIAGTLVVRKGHTPQEIAQAPPAQTDAVGIILAIVALFGFVAFIGIVAAIAIPVYQDYTIRSQVSEGLALAAPYERQVTQAIGAGTDVRSADSASLGTTERAAGRYVDSVIVQHGAVVITYGAAANRLIQGHKLVLHPIKVSAQSIAWACGYKHIDGAQLDAPNLADATDIPQKFLPQPCRE